MSEVLQRHIGPMPTWLMFSGATIGIVGASVTKHAESVGEFVVALDSRADTSNLAAAAPGRWGLGLLIVGAVVALSGLVVAARVIEPATATSMESAPNRDLGQTRTPRFSARPANPHVGWPDWQASARVNGTCDHGHLSGSRPRPACKPSRGGAQQLRPRTASRNYRRRMHSRAARPYSGTAVCADCHGHEPRDYSRAVGLRRSGVPFKGPGSSFPFIERRFVASQSSRCSSVRTLVLYVVDAVAVGDDV